MSLEIRRIDALSDSDAEALAALLPQLNSDLQPPSAAALQAVAAGDRTALFVARDGARPCGMLTLAWYDVPSGRKAWIEDVVVDAASRRCGAGRALVRAAVAHAAALGIGRLSLTSNPSRTAAHALYLASGFEKAETAVFALKPKKP